MEITKNKMIQELQDKFGSEILEQAVWMDTQRTFDIYLMTQEELERLYYRFFTKRQVRKPMVSAEYLMEQEELRKLRSIILSDAQYLGIYTPNNWNRFNYFMLHRSVLKKALTHYKIEEFPALIRQFKSMRSKFNESKYKVGTKEWYQFFNFPMPGLN